MPKIPLHDIIEQVASSCSASDMLKQDRFPIVLPAIRLTEKQLELDFIEQIVALLRQSSSSEETTFGHNRRTE